MLSTRFKSEFEGECVVYTTCEPCTWSLHRGRLHVLHPPWVLCSLCSPRAVVSVGALEDIPRMLKCPASLRESPAALSKVAALRVMFWWGPCHGKLSGSEMPAPVWGWQRAGNEGVGLQNGDTDSQKFPGCGCLDAQVSLRPTSACREAGGCNVQLPLVIPITISTASSHTS